MANPDKFWVTSFGSAAKYIRERNAASVSEISVTEDSITINVSDTLDNSHYDCPITVRRPLPQGWSSAYVVQNGDTLTSQIVEVGSVRYLMFDVVPDDGNITLIESRATGIALQNTQTIPSSFELHQNYPNPFNPITMISFHLPIAGRVSLKVYDMLGREIAALVDEAKSAGKYSVHWDAQRVASGVYFYQLQAGAYSATKKLLLLK